MGSLGEPDPSVWSKLPHELLESVFVHLPIGRIRALSKSWNQAGSTCSTFTRAYAKLQPKLCGIMWRDFTSETHCVRVYNTESGKWLPAFDIQDIPECPSPATACDGGLICLASTCQPSQREMEFLPVIVANPLTREWRQLPPPRLVQKCESVQLEVNRRTGAYSILLSGSQAGGVGTEVMTEAYNSSTSEWSRVESGLVLYLDKLSGTPLVCNSSTGEVRAYAPPNPRGEVLQLKTHRNDLYLLELIPGVPDWMVSLDGDLIIFDEGCPSSSFIVSKYKVGNSGFAWNGSTHECELVDIPGDTLLLVSGSFLLIVRHSFQYDHLMMFYDMEESKWHDFDWNTGTVLSSVDWENAFSCELRWDACP